MKSLSSVFISTGKTRDELASKVSRIFFYVGIVGFPVKLNFERIQNGGN